MIIPTPHPARRVRVSTSHGCALLQGGAVACFGAAYSDGLGYAADPNDVKGSRPARIVEGLPRAIDVTVGPSLSCAVTEALDVYCWGTFHGKSVRQEIVPRKIRVTG
jgi:hypothetical protein